MPVTFSGVFKRSATPFKGSALMEYVVPSTILLLTVGLVTTLTDINTLVADYFVASSGYTKSDIVGNQFKLNGMINDVSYSLGNGMQAFNSYARVTDGNRNNVASSAAGTFYWGSVSREGGRKASGSNEYLY